LYGCSAVIQASYSSSLYSFCHTSQQDPQSVGIIAKLGGSFATAQKMRLW
jgi:hypothetical protein